jgi:hypothetical protein
LFTSDFENDDLDIVADNDALIDFSGQYQH